MPLSLACEMELRRRLPVTVAPKDAWMQRPRGFAELPPEASV
jgi:hypothetical protein